MEEHDTSGGVNNSVERTHGKRCVWDLAFVSGGLLLLDQLEGDWQM